MNFYETILKWAALAPESVAVSTGETDVTYSELTRLVSRCAAGLRASGTEPGDRILLYTPNVPEQLVVYLACAHIGAVFTSVNIGFRARELTYVCANARPRIGIVHEDHVDAFHTYTDHAEGRPEQLFVLGGTGDTRLGTFDELLTDLPSFPPLECAPDADLLLVYTSGTTSAPKPVLHSHGSELFKANGYADVWGLRAGDRGVVAMSLGWGMGLTVCEALLARGATIELLPRFHPVEVVETIEQKKATVMLGTMTMYQKILDVLKHQPRDLTSLRLCVNGGEPTTATAIRLFETQTGCRLVGAYAMTEARPILAVRHDDLDAPRDSCGTLVAGAEIRLLGEDGRPVEAGNHGEAEVRCPGTMTSYYREPELTSDRLSDDGWVKTGDLLLADARGYYFVVGRRSDMIIRSGANIAPAEVESALLTYEYVSAAAVVGVPDEISGEAVVAFIVSAGTREVLPSELKEHLAGELAAYKVPQYFFEIDELPVNRSGKRDRKALKEKACRRVQEL